MPLFTPSDCHDGFDGESPSRAALERAYVVFIGTSPLLASVAVQLVQLGLGRWSVGSDRELTPDDVDATAWLDAEDLGATLYDALLRRRGGDGRSPASHGGRAALRELVSGASLLVAAIEGPLWSYRWVRELDALAHAVRVPWTSVTLRRTDEAAVGPAVLPGESACHACYATRRVSTTVRPEAYAAVRNIAERNIAERNIAERNIAERNIAEQCPGRGLFGGQAAVLDAVAALGVAHVEACLGGDRNAAAFGRVRLVDLVSMTTSEHLVVPVPDCEVCGGIALESLP